MTDPPTDRELRLAADVVDWIATHATTDRDRNRFERVAGDIDKFMLARRVMDARLEMRDAKC